MKSIKNYSINWNVTKPYSHWHNWEGGAIKQINLRWKSTMWRTGFSPRLWYYSMKHDAELFSHFAPKDRSPPLEKVIGDTIDISEYLDSGFYDLVWYWGTLIGEKGEALPGRCLGISHRVGSGMCYWVLNKQGNVVSLSTV